MPNWCMNNLQITGSKEEIEEINQKLTEKKGVDFFDIFIEPAGEDNDDWYAYNNQHYGCKWNCTTHTWDVDGDGTTISISFDSPWGPPEALFNTLSERYQSVLAYYYEPGMAFCGKFEDGYDECYDVPGSADEVEATVPDDINYFFGIAEQMRDWEEDPDNQPFAEEEEEPAENKDS